MLAGRGTPRLGARTNSRMSSRARLGVAAGRRLGLPHATATSGLSARLSLRLSKASVSGPSGSWAASEAMWCLSRHTPSVGGRPEQAQHFTSTGRERQTPRSALRSLGPLPSPSAFQNPGKKPASGVHPWTRVLAGEPATPSFLHPDVFSEPRHTPCAARRLEIPADALLSRCPNSGKRKQTRNK